MRYLYNFKKKRTMKTTIKLFSLGLVSALAFSSCSDSFLEEKKNYDNVNKDVYNYYEGCDGRVNDIYSWCLPTTNDLTWKYPSMGNADEAGKSTEEYSGLSSFVDPQVELSSTSTTNSVPDFFMGDQSNIQASVYGRIRNVNDVIQGISGSTLSEEQKNELLGQVYFFRAWCYYNLFKWYGGVPLVKETQDPVESSVTPRATSKETYEFILDDLNKAAELKYGKLPSLKSELAKEEEIAERERGDESLLRDKVTDDEIARIVSRWTGIPVTKLKEGEREKLLQLPEELHRRVIGQDEAVQKVSEAILRSRAGIADENRPIGSFLFLGLYLGIMFMMATVLIIYYKQISEGYDDHDRFVILQNVGMSKQEVKSTINKQILLVFFLPLLMAAVHMLFAFNIVANILMVFSMMNRGLFAVCCLCIFAVFSLVYLLVYKLTSRSYYRLVRAS